MPGINTTMDARAAQWYCGYNVPALSDTDKADKTKAQAIMVPGNLLSGNALPSASVSALDGGGTAPSIGQTANTRDQTILGSQVVIKFPDPPTIDDVVFELLYVPTNTVHMALIAAQGNSTLRTFARKQTNGSLWTAQVFDGTIASASLQEGSNGADVLAITVARQGTFTVVSA